MLVQEAKIGKGVPDCNNNPSAILSKSSEGQLKMLEMRRGLDIHQSMIHMLKARCCLLVLN